MKTNNDLRETLFEVLEAVKSGAMSIEQAKAVNDTAQTIINTAKVDVDYAKVMGGSITFLESDSLPDGVVGIRQHRLKG